MRTCLSADEPTNQQLCFSEDGCKYKAILFTHKPF
jgi:hypothetical protein